MTISVDWHSMFSFTLFIRTYTFSCVAIQRNNRHMRNLFLLLSLIPVTNSDTENILKKVIKIYTVYTHISVLFSFFYQFTKYKEVQLINCLCKQIDIYANN